MRMPEYTAQQGLNIGSTPQVPVNDEIGKAIENLGHTAEDVGNRYVEMQQQKQQYNTGLSFQDFNQQQSNKLDQNVRGQQPGAEGLYKQGADTFDTDAATWLKSQPPAMQEEYGQKIQILRDKYHGAYADAEATGRKSWEMQTNSQSLVTSQNQAFANPSNADAIIQDANTQIDKMTVDPSTKLALKNQAARSILQSAFDAQHGTDVAGAAKTLGVRDPTAPVTTTAPATADGVWANMLHKENQPGDPAAVSPKGALGLAQVMPGTAREVAAGLGMADVAKMDDAQLKTYFTAHPDVNEKIGRTYFNQQLSKYNGDPQAAVIAYNAGPGVADKWIAAGRDDAMLPKETQDYKSTVLGGATAGYDPNSGDLPSGGPARGTAVSSNIPGMAPVAGARFNYANTSNMGDPRAPGWAAQNITPIKAPNGQEWQVNKQAAPAFQGFLADLAAEGYDAKSSGGYSLRNVTGGSTLSQHAWGNAIDIDAPNNAQGSTKTNLPANVRELAQKWGLVWGMDIKGRPDPMHFEFAGPAAGQASGATAPGATAPQQTFTPADPRYNLFTPEEREAMFNQVKTRATQDQAVARATLEPRVQDATSAFLATGHYTGQVPTQQDFTQAYGAVDGSQRYAQFQRVQQVGAKVDSMKTSTPIEMQSMVDAAKPVGSGPGFAAQQQSYEALQQAAAANQKARLADPVAYSRQAAPAIDAMWKNAQSPADIQTAMGATAAFQSQIGIPPEQQKLLPEVTAKAAADKFKDGNVPTQDRIAAVMGLITRTSDINQQLSVFQQLVANGVPPETEGAIEAYARGSHDGSGSAAGDRLMAAALSQPGKIPGEQDVKMKDIKDAIDTNVLAPGKPGDASYQVSMGTPENFMRAQRGSQLMIKAVQMRIAQGETLDTAVPNVVKDMFGNAAVMTATPAGQSASVMVPANVDQSALGAHLDASKSQVMNTLADQGEAHAKAMANGNPSLLASLEADGVNRARDILSQGKWVNMGGGFAFLDAYTNKVVEAAPGKPLIVNFNPSQQQPAVITAPTLPAAPAADASDATLDQQNNQDRVSQQNLFGGIVPNGQLQGEHAIPPGALKRPMQAPATVPGQPKPVASGNSAFNQLRAESKDPDVAEPTGFFSGLFSGDSN